MNLNKITLMGNVGANPRTSTVDGEPNAVFQLVLTRAERDRKSGVLLRAVDIYPIVTVGKLAEIVKQYVRKGDRLYVEGKLRTTRVTRSNGGTTMGIEIVAQNLIMLGSARREKNGEE